MQSGSLFHGAMRTIVDSAGGRWFVARDVCRKLGLGKARDIGYVVRRHCPGRKRLYQLPLARSVSFRDIQPHTWMIGRDDMDNLIAVAERRVLSQGVDFARLRHPCFGDLRVFRHRGRLWFAKQDVLDLFACDDFVFERLKTAPTRRLFFEGGRKQADVYFEYDVVRFLAMTRFPARTELVLRWLSDCGTRFRQGRPRFDDLLDDSVVM